MLILKGTKTVDLSKDELTEIIGQFDRVHIDLGTGDGRNIYKLAINDQNTFYNEIQDDIRVEFSYFDDDDVMLQTLKASVAEGKDIPDIVVVQSGVYLEDLKDIFTPINNYLSEDYKSSTRYWETTTFSDEIYGYAELLDQANQ